jgi:hypothetical protein
MDRRSAILAAIALAAAGPVVASEGDLGQGRVTLKIDGRRIVPGALILQGDATATTVDLRIVTLRLLTNRLPLQRLGDLGRLFRPTPDEFRDGATPAGNLCLDGDRLVLAAATSLPALSSIALVHRGIDHAIPPQPLPASPDLIDTTQLPRVGTAWLKGGNLMISVPPED